MCVTFSNKIKIFTLKGRVVQPIFNFFTHEFFDRRLMFKNAQHELTSFSLHSGVQFEPRYNSTQENGNNIKSTGIDVCSALFGNDSFYVFE